LQPGKYQPRNAMEQEPLEELAASISTQGVIQPIIVRSIHQGHYEIIAGERRWRASQLAGLSEIPAIIKDINDETASAISLIENIQRENLNPVEESVAITRLINEFSMTHEGVAKALGKSRTAITNLIRLQELNITAKTFLERSEIELGHAKVLLGLSGTQQDQAAKIVAEKGMSVRETERLVKKLKNPAPQAEAKTQDPNIQRLENDLSEKLKAKVQVQHGNQGKGKVVIHYNTLDELDGILEQM